MTTGTTTAAAPAGTARPSRFRTALRAADLGLLLVVFGAGVRLWTWAANRSLWLDEQMISMNLRDRGFAELVGVLDNQQAAPVGWLWAQRALVELFGSGERTLRFLPMLFGIGTLVVAWLIGRRWLGPVGTVALVGFCAVNEAFVNYSTQVKHYTADAFWVLVLLGLAGWVIEEPARLRRLAVWWLTAAVAAWFSLGAIIAVPALALVLVGAVWWRGRWWAALRGAALGLVWLASFVPHYLLALRVNTTGNAYMTQSWQGIGYPPAGAGPLGTARWLLRRPEVLSADPLHLDAGLPGDTLPRLVAVLFWLLVLVGIGVAFRRRPAFGLLLAAPVATAFLLAIARVVPLAVRLALWFVPVLFVAVACALQAVMRAPASAGAGPGQHRPGAGAGGGWWRWAAGVAGVLMLAALVPAGVAAVSAARARPALDDRAAIAWLAANRRPDDLLLVFGSATRAFQWYDHPRTMSPTAVLTAPTGADCTLGDLAAATAGRRVLAYSGVQYAPYQKGAEVLGARLAELGRVTEQRFGTLGVVYILEPGPPGPPPRAIDLGAVRYNCVRVL